MTIVTTTMISQTIPWNTPSKLHAVAEGEIESFQDHELGSEQDQPCAEEAQ